MLTSVAVIVGGVAIVLIGLYFWNHPDQYYRHLHGASVLAAVNARPPEWSVKLGAALAVIAGVAVTVWGFGGLIFD